MLISYLCTYKPNNYANENKGFPKFKKKLKAHLEIFSTSWQISSNPLNVFPFLINWFISVYLIQNKITMNGFVLYLFCTSVLFCLFFHVFVCLSVCPCVCLSLMTSFNDCQPCLSVSPFVFFHFLSSSLLSSKTCHLVVDRAGGK